MSERIIGNYAQLKEIVEREHIDKIVVALPDRRGTLPLEDLLVCKQAGVDIEEGAAFYEKMSGRILLESIGPGLVVFSKDFVVSPLLQLQKRMVDFLLALFGLLVFGPLMVALAILIKVGSSGPAFYTQERVGRGGKPFIIYKFRSMYVDAEATTGPVFAQQNDTRTTRVGKYLRRSHLDELPQLFNILRGDMSFVGPRPERPFFSEQYEKEIPYYSQRFASKPGLTGWAQVNYPYGDSIEDTKEKLQFDLYYIKNISLLLDFYILTKTAKITLLGRGAR